MIVNNFDNPAIFIATNSCGGLDQRPFNIYAVWSDRSLILLCLLTLIVLMFVTYKVFKIVRFSDPVFLLMLVFLQFSLLAEIIFDAYDI